MFFVLTIARIKHRSGWLRRWRETTSGRRTAGTRAALERCSGTAIATTATSRTTTGWTSASASRSGTTSTLLRRIDIQAPSIEVGAVEFLNTCSGLLRRRERHESKTAWAACLPIRRKKAVNDFTCRPKESRKLLLGGSVVQVTNKNFRRNDPSSHGAPCAVLFRCRTVALSARETSSSCKVVFANAVSRAQTET